ncbi:MAG TPA: hypothetical protein VHX37_06470 [Acidobacteriaceae bacterium]|nr:hypothetical protein [Acidobacteriaceae bacterium]
MGRIQDTSVNRLKDEVYREMFRFEAGHPEAELRLAIALLHAWLAVEGRPRRSATRSWLLQICPVCLQMIEEGRRPPRREGSADL